MAGKFQLATAISEKEKIGITQAERIVTVLFSEMDRRIRAGEMVQIYGFGMFKMGTRKGCTRKMPTTGDKIHNIPDRRLIKFKASKG